MSQVIAVQPQAGHLAQRAVRLRQHCRGHPAGALTRTARAAPGSRAAAGALQQHPQHPRAAAAAAPQQAALSPAGSPVFQLAVVASPAVPQRAPPQNVLIIGGVQIPNFLVWVLLSAVGFFWALFIGVLIALFPTLHEVRPPGQSYPPPSRTIITTYLRPHSGPN